VATSEGRNRVRRASRDVKPAHKGHPVRKWSAAEQHGGLQWVQRTLSTEGCQDVGEEWGYNKFVGALI